MIPSFVVAFLFQTWAGPAADVSAFREMSLAEPVRRDHGPGTSGGGIATPSGETMKPGAVSVSLRLDYTQFERLTPTEIQAMTFETNSGGEGHVDAVRWTLLETFEVAFGAMEDLQIGFSFGYYRAADTQEGHLDDTGTYDFHEIGDISGMTDQWITAKYRVIRGAGGSLALLGGVKLPFGDNSETNHGSATGSNEPLDPALQPGSGAFDFLLGAAYSRYLTERVTLDTGLSYTRRTKRADFKMGDLVLFGVAAAYRFTENVATYPQSSAFLEVNVRHLFMNREGAHEEENSGGTALFVSPGFRVAFSERVSFTISPQIPVAQHLNEEQQKTLFKVAMGITVSF